MKIAKMIQEKQGTIVDVRSYGVFMGGHVVDSTTIVMNEILERIDELKNLQMPLILCCASVNRSGQDQRFRSQEGIECYNGRS